jgi:hypothetical protein
MRMQLLGCGGYELTHCHTLTHSTPLHSKSPWLYTCAQRLMLTLLSWPLSSLHLRTMHTQSRVVHLRPTRESRHAKGHRCMQASQNQKVTLSEAICSSPERQLVMEQIKYEAHRHHSATFRLKDGTAPQLLTLTKKVKAVKTSARCRKNRRCCT